MADNMEVSETGTVVTSPQLLRQGAEAKLYTGSFHERPVIIKERFVKGYRHPALDQMLTAQRTKSEVRSMMRCRANGIRTPVVYFVDLAQNKIYMEYLVDSITVRDHIRLVQKQPNVDLVSALGSLAEKIGKTLGKMHRENIIHGDLTTSNMLMTTGDEKHDLIMIDFGLGYIENVAEDKGVDLYVLERALLSTHPNTESLFEIIMDSYKKCYGHGVEEVIKKLDEVRMRGRKRTMVG